MKFTKTNRCVGMIILEYLFLIILYWYLLILNTQFHFLSLYDSTKFAVGMLSKDLYGLVVVILDGSA